MEGMSSNLDADKNVIIQDGVTGADAPKTEEPKLLAGKYKTPEDLEKGYMELQKLLGEKGGEKKEEKPAEEQKPAEENKTEDSKQEMPDAVTKALTEAGVSLDNVTQEIQTNGKLSDETYDKLAKVGYSKQIVDTFIAGQMAEVTAVQNQIDSIKASIGGEEEFQKMLVWAKGNYSPDQAKAYNDAVDSGKPTLIELAVKKLAQDYQKTYGKAPNLLNGSKANNVGEVFESTEQVVKAMSDPRYKNDSAYRADVMKKIARSKAI